MKTKYIQYQYENKDTRKRIFCFPYAGGGAFFYSKWHQHLPENIGVYPIQLSGRENRMKEPLCNDLKRTIEEIINEIKGLLDYPFVFVGHSMGGLMSYEAARFLRKNYGKRPEGILISGTVPPDKLVLTEKIGALDDSEFCIKLMGYDNMEPKMMEYKEFYQYFLPVLRNDFQMVETYAAEDEEPLDCPIKVIGGTEDPFVPVELLKGWRNYTTRETEIKLYDGNHFFIKNHMPKACGLIEEMFSARR